MSIEQINSERASTGSPGRRMMALGLPEHVEQSIQAVAKLHADHDRTTTQPQRVVGRIVDMLGRPSVFVMLLMAVILWTGINKIPGMRGRAAIDPPPFAWLELGSSIAALCITLLILTTQRRDDRLAQHREQMTLQLAILSDQKLAKIIDLIEESRRDNPLIEDREDSSAEAMATPADPELLGGASRVTGT